MKDLTILWTAFSVVKEFVVVDPHQQTFMLTATVLNKLAN